MASTYLTRTFGSSGSQQTATFSVWVKRGNLGGGGKSLFGYDVDASNFLRVGFKSNDQLAFRNYNGGTYTWQLETNRVFRDTSAWYHIVFEVDSTQATSSDRLKLYVNGVQETSFSTATYPSQNANMKWGNNAYAHIIGDATGGDIFDGIMSHINVIDGTAYDASYFGETDSATGEWKIKTSPSVTYGTNGFFILKDGNSVTDQSGNSNNYTVGGGTLTNTEDNPSNVFATFNALAYFGKGSALENGNTRAYGDSATSNNECSFTTLTGSSGKYYAEFKIAFVGDGSFIGISDIEYTILENNDGQYRPFTIMVRSNGTLNVRGSGYGAPTTTGSWSSSYTTNDILQVAMDLDNNYFYFGKNGTWQNSGVPSSGATGTGGVAITSDKNYAFTFGGYGSSPSAYANFGNGYFGTTAVASAGTNASGNGIFEYDVPTGYTALSTKGLNE
jgi:hypothetical protein